MSKYPSQTQDKFTVRFPDGMRDEIAKRAEKNGRSMNSEIIEMLKYVLERNPLWLDEGELYIQHGIRTSPIREKNPNIINGLLLTEIKEKIDELSARIEAGNAKEDDISDKK
ncbi:Arc family DNA-binding protein [Morganella morganii subsp. morganii]|uniref:Arc family DNA-binding protein n=1 Tax=Morganella morganii TaxID=582 RepID=UPI001BDAE387|nr:Arc family DNA-binding protein [Morganella morganii]MBT0350256.1 Arc family DNA-binding protein [Morganella morganii subsp. morganii]